MNEGGGEVGVRNVSARTDFEDVLGVLVDAFEMDPVQIHLTPNPTRRRKFLTHMYRSVMVARPNRIFSSSDGRSVMLTLLSNAENITTAEFIFKGGIRAVWQWNFSFYLTGLHFFDMLEARRLFHTRDFTRYYHVVLFGTDATCRGKGIGSKVMKYLTDLADAESTVIYLEASSEASKRLYERHAFVVKEIVYPPLQASMLPSSSSPLPPAPPMFLMIRLPITEKRQ